MRKQYNYLELIPKVEAYIEACKDKDIAPMLEEFALGQDIPSSTVRNWSSYDGEDPAIQALRDSLKKLKDASLIQLSRQAQGRYPAGSIFLLKALHGLRDQPDKADSKPSLDGLTVVINVPDSQASKY